MDAALRGQHCLSRPLLMVTNLTSTADGVDSPLGLAPSVEEETKGKGKMPKGRETVLGQLGIPKCISPQPATAATMVESKEMKPHNCKLHFQDITVVLVQNALCSRLKSMMFFFSRDNRGNPISDCMEGSQWEFIHWSPQLIHKWLGVSTELCMCISYTLVYHAHLSLTPFFIFQ